MVEQGYRPAACRYAGFVEAGQHAVGECGGPHAAAGKSESDDHIVGGIAILGVGCRLDLIQVRTQRLVDRIIVDELGATGEEGGAGKDAPRTDSTLDPLPHH